MGLRVAWPECLQPLLLFTEALMNPVVLEILGKGKW